jgi:putative membrane protein
MSVVHEPPPHAAGARRHRRPRELRDVGREPDPRFSFANERTFLAWNRTGLALVGGGLVVHQFVTAGPAVLRTLLAALLIVLGCAVAGAAYGHWRRSEVALRLGEPLPHSMLLGLLSTGVAVVGLVTALLVVLGHSA